MIRSFLVVILLGGCGSGMQRETCMAMADANYSEQLYRACRDQPGELEECYMFEPLRATHVADLRRCDQ